MAVEQGIVFSNTEDGQAQVVIQRKSACAGCGSSQCCISLGSASTKMVVNAVNRVGANAGDLVSITLESQTLIGSAAIAYMIPFAGLISGVVAGVHFGRIWMISEDVASMLLGFVGLLLGVGIAALIYRSISAGKNLTPEITRIIQKDVQVPRPVMATDPVCKMMVDPAEAPASVINNDKTYYFCSPACKDSFLKDPNRYL